jgi:hypothetical protein
LNHPATLANLLYVGKSYGDGAIKVEPRQLEALELPPRVIQECLKGCGIRLASHGMADTLPDNDPST